MVQWRRVLGALLIDLPRYVVCMMTKQGWIRMRNRADAVRRAETGVGVACDWEHTRTLHLCDVFPVTGKWLLRRALRDYPITRQDRPKHQNGLFCCGNADIAEDAVPDISFLIGHRGKERLPLLMAVLESIAAQCDVSFEALVVEQDTTPVIRDSLPDWVRYVHNPCPDAMPYNRSQTFNVAAAHARAPLLVLHDNDMLLPQSYAAEACRLAGQGYEVINMKRFIFYMAEASPRIMENNVQSVVQNLEGGGSVAIVKHVFDAIGGMDEAFVGWGGEDMEFWGRCLTRKVWEYTFLPIVHLWHAAQPGKRAKRGLGEATADLTDARLAMVPEQRIAELVDQRRGG